MRHIRVLICQVDDGGPGWVAHPWLTDRGRAVDTAPGHRTSARCDQVASVGGRGASERADDLTSQHRGMWQSPATRLMPGWRNSCARPPRSASLLSTCSTTTTRSSARRSRGWPRTAASRSCAQPVAHPG